MSRKRCELRKYVKYDFYARWNFPSKSNHCENHTVRLWLAISCSKVQIFTHISSRFASTIFTPPLSSCSCYLCSLVTSSQLFHFRFQIVNSLRISCTTRSSSEYSSMADFRVSINMLIFVIILFAFTNSTSTNCISARLLDTHQMRPREIVALMRSIDKLWVITQLL